MGLTPSLLVAVLSTTGNFHALAMDVWEHFPKADQLNGLNINFSLNQLPNTSHKWGGGAPMCALCQA